MAKRPAPPPANAIHLRTQPGQFGLAILKGVIEANDTSKHFGSLGAHTYWCDKTVELGLIAVATQGPPRTFQPTPLGRWVYDALPPLHAFRSRCAAWNWRSLPPYLVPPGHLSTTEPTR